VKNESDDKNSAIKTKPKVALVYNLKREVKSKTKDDQAEYDTLETIDAVCLAIERNGFKTECFEADKQLPKLLLESKCDLVFNIAEGKKGRSREAQVPALLELLEIPFTGSDAASMAIALDKDLTKRVVRSYDVRTPNHCIIKKEYGKCPDKIIFPCIVKPVYEGSGKAIAQSSIVLNDKQMEKIAFEKARLYGTSFMLEEFIEGREFTVGILGNEGHLRVFEPMEIVFKESKPGVCPIYDYEVKTNNTKFVEFCCPAQIPESMANEMMSMARTVFNVLGCRDFARVDFRCSKSNVPYFLEINPLPGLAPNYSDYPRIASCCGMDFDSLIGEIIRSAVKRYGTILPEVF
jgi:D-alanine-D-alanine ligase